MNKTQVTIKVWVSTNDLIKANLRKARNIYGEELMKSEFTHMLIKFATEAPGGPLSDSVVLLTIDPA